MKFIPASGKEHVREVLETKIPAKITEEKIIPNNILDIIPDVIPEEYVDMVEYFVGLSGIMNNVFSGYEPYKGDIETRERGSIIAHETGESTGYGLFNTQDRGRLFIGPGVEVYEGMIVGESSRNEDIVCNVCKKKQMTNTRAAGSDDALRLVPHTVLSLEQCMEFIKDDELLEVTPESLRLRKRILAKDQRLKQQFRKK